MKKMTITNLMTRFYVGTMFAFLIGFSSCSKDSDNETPKVQKTSNVIIINEGTFGAQDGTLSSFALENSIVQSKLYQTANQAGVGGLINSGIVHDDRMYAIINSLDKVEVMDAKTFTHVASITEQMKIPRYAVMANKKLYVSNWGAYNDSWQNPNSYVLVIDVSTNSIIKKIDLKNGVDHMLVIGDELFVAHSQEAKISVINTKSDKVSSEIQLSGNPRKMLLDQKNNIWVAIGAKKVSKINAKSKSVIETIAINLPEKESLKGSYAAWSPKGDKIYYLTGESWPSKVTNFYEIDVTTQTLSASKLISKDNMYSFGVDPTDGTIYVGIAPDFTSNGVVVRFKPDGSELDNFTAGVAPKAFIFK